KTFASFFKSGQHMDMLMILPSELPRLERVCAPFYTRAQTTIPNWMRMLLAVLLGNLVYFATETAMPAVLRHDLYQVDAGLLVDFALCVGIYLLLRARPAKK